jgi:Amino acid permease
MSLGRLLKWFQHKGWFGPLLRLKWFSPEQHSELTPVGALFLHLCSCLVLIFATCGLSSTDAYSLLTGLSAYVVNCFFGTLLGLGILILRTRGPPATPSEMVSDLAGLPPTWKHMTGKRFSPALSYVTATAYTVGNIFPIVAKWFPTRGIFWINLVRGADDILVYHYSRCPLVLGLRGHGLESGLERPSCLCGRKETRVPTRRRRGQRNRGWLW